MLMDGPGVTDGNGPEGGIEPQPFLPWRPALSLLMADRAIEVGHDETSRLAGLALPARTPVESPQGNRRAPRSGARGE
jgi:hypothetical protein